MDVIAMQVPSRKKQSLEQEIADQGKGIHALAMTDCFRQSLAF